MRQTLLIVAIVAAAFLAVQVLFPEEDEVPGSGAQGAPSASGSGRSDKIIDPARARGSDIFSPETRTALIDGEEVVYQAMIMWCGRAEPAEEESFLLSDVAVLVNPTPRTREDLEALFQVTPTMAARQVGEEIRRRVAEGSGIMAGQARIDGSPRISQAESVRFDGGVDAHISAGLSGSRAARIEGPTLTVHIAEGHIYAAETDQEVTLSTGEGTIRGVGLSADLVTGRIEVKRQIHATLEDRRARGVPDLPMVVTGDGPLTYVIDEPTSDDELPGSAAALRSMLDAPGVLELRNHVLLTQGETAIEGDRLIVEHEGPDPADRLRGIRHVRMEGNVKAIAEEGSFRGSVARLERRPDGAVQMELQGPGVGATLHDAATVIPILDREGDLQVDTAGTIRVVRLAEGAPGQRVAEVQIGPGVTLSAGESQLAARLARLHIHRIPANRATEVETKRRDYPCWIELSGGVQGQGPGGELSGQLLTYTRTHDPMGLPQEDRVRLEGKPYVSFAFEAPAGPPAEGLWERLQRSPGSVDINARDSLEVRRDPLDIGPLRALARGDVRGVRKVVDAAGESSVLATVQAQALDARIRPAWRSDALEEQGSGSFRALRVLDYVGAQGQVAASITGQVVARGSLLEFDRAAGQALLTGSAEGSRARLVVTDRDRNEQAIGAPRIRYRESIGELSATGGTESALHLPPLPFPGSEKSEIPIPTAVTAERLALTFAGGLEGATGVRPSEILAEVGVRIRQENMLATCSFARVAPETRNAVVRGSPARIDVTRIVAGRRYEEFLTARSLTLRGEEALLEGDVAGRFHSAPRGLAMSMVVRPQRAPVPPSTQAPAALIPFAISSRGNLYLSRKSILLHDAAQVSQGDPANDGFSVAGNKITLMLLPAEPGTSRVRVARAVAEDQVEFKSRDLEGRGEVMVFNQDRRIVSLRSTKGTSTLRWQGRYEHPRQEYVLDFKNPDRPTLVSVRPKEGGRQR